MFEYRDFEVFWDGAASLRVRDNEFTVAVDPSAENSRYEAGIVLITSGDEQHFSREALKNVCGRGTCVVLPESMRGVDVPCTDVEYVGPGDNLDIFSVEIETLGSEDRISYRFDMRGTSFYVTGDSGFLNEVIELENRVDIAFLQASGENDFEEDDIVRTAVRIKPEIAVPYHYGRPFDDHVNLDNLKADLEDRNIKCRTP
ncbi:MAG: MBL fold metallo-hydrolase [Candidatus Aenigmatarchaeota archaeon]